MGKPLVNILEIEFQLLYHLGLTQADIDSMDLTERDWKYGRLIEQKQKEIKAAQDREKEST